MTQDVPPHLRLLAKGICKAFATPVLQDVDLEVPVGSIHGLVGENGAGKTTLAKIIVGLEQADSGSLHLDGQPYQPTNTAASLSAGVAVCAQELSLIDDLTISENILLHTSASSIARIRRKRTDEVALGLLKLVGLEHANPRTRVSALSLAEKQLVEIAKTLAIDAKLLVLDEPTSALTRPQSERLHEIVREKASEGVTVIYISHRLGDVLNVCDTVSVLRDGQVRLTGESRTMSEKVLIREMAGMDAGVDVESRPIEKSAPVHLSVEGLRTSQLPQPISFNCRRGEILGIAGLAGSGRTELLNAVFGLHRRLAGTVKVHEGGTTRETANPRQAIKCGIGLVAEDRSRDGVFKDQALAFNVTVAGLGKISDQSGRLVRKKETSAVARLIESLKVRSEGPDQKMRELSGGNQQKSMLARWLHCESRLLLLDEPTRGVDVAAKLAIHAELLRLRDSGITVIAVSSELEELQNICDRILVLSKRVLVAEFHRSNWSQREILAAAFSEHAGEDMPPSVTAQ